MTIELPFWADSLHQRHVGVTLIRLHGDRERAIEYIPQAQKYMGFLRHRLAQGGIGVGKRYYNLPRGAKIEVRHNSAMNIIDIYVPPEGPEAVMGTIRGMRYPFWHYLPSDYTRYDGHGVVLNRTATKTYNAGVAAGAHGYWNSGVYDDEWFYETAPWEVYWSGADPDTDPDPQLIVSGGSGLIQAETTLITSTDTTAEYDVSWTIHAERYMDQTHLWLPNKRIMEYSYDYTVTGRLFCTSLIGRTVVADSDLAIQYRRLRIFDENPWGDWLSTETSGGVVASQRDGELLDPSTFGFPTTATMRLRCVRFPQYSLSTSDTDLTVVSTAYGPESFLKTFDAANLEGPAAASTAFAYPGAADWYADIIYVPVYNISYWDNMTCTRRMLDDYRFRVEHGLNYV